MLTVICILALAAVVLAIAALAGKVNGGVAVLLLALIELLRCLPLGAGR